MNKKRLSILALLLVIILTLSLGLFVACNNGADSDKSEQTTVTATEGLLISNGDFKVLSTATSAFPRNITDWSGGKMYSSGSFDSDVVAGAINLEKKKYDENKAKWSDKSDTLYNLLTANGRYGADDEIKNALMIYMPEKGTDLGVKDAKYGPTAYGFTSKSFTLDKQSYYKFTVDVLTYNLKGTLDKDGNPNNEDEIGARIYLSSNTYQEYAAIDTNGAWQTYTFYIESSPTASASLTVLLGLGKYTTYYTGGLTTGYAVFDNVSLEKLDTTGEGSAEKTPEAQFGDAQTKELDQLNPSGDPDAVVDEYVKTATLVVPNGRFDFGSSSISSSAAPFNWSSVTGNSNAEDPAPTALGYNGIIDASEFINNYSKYSGSFYTHTGEVTQPGNMLSNLTNLDTFLSRRAGKNVFMLSQQLMTAQGIKSSKTITIERGKFYEISIDVYTFGIAGAGVTLSLTGNDGKTISIEGISKNTINRTNTNGNLGATEMPTYTDNLSTTGGWQTYTFHIKGNQYKDYAYNMELWLGTGGTSDNNALKYTKFTSSTSNPTPYNATTYNGNGTFSTGWTFFDELNVKKISSTEYENSEATSVTSSDKGFILDASNGNKAVKVDLESNNMFTADITGISGDFSAKADDLSNDYDYGTDGTPTGFMNYIDEENDKAPLIDPSYVKAGAVDLSTGETQDNYFAGLNIDHPKTPYDIKTKAGLMIYASKDTAFSMETKPFTILPNTFYRISLWVKTAAVKSTSGIDVFLMDTKNTPDDKKDDTSLSSFTKINTKKFDAYTDDWCELTFVIRGNNTEANNVFLRFSLGSGNRTSTSTLTTGAAFVTNMCLDTITYKNFTNTSTGTYVKSINMATSETSSFSNGGFNQFDVENSEGLDGGLLSGKAGVPLNWTISDSKLYKNGTGEDGENLAAGIIKLDSADGNTFTASKQTSTVLGSAYDNDFNNLYNNAPFDAVGGPSMLALAGLNNSKFAVGYTSDSFSLTSQGIYVLSVYVKTLSAAKGMIYLSGETTGQPEFGQTHYILIDESGASDWTKYIFYIEVGLSNVSLKLNLWLGYNENVDPELAVGGNSEEKTASLKSSGILLFDMVDLKTRTKEDFDNITTESDTARKLSFLNEGFDMLTTSVESRKELTTPTNWTGTEDSEQSKSSSKGGMIYADADYLEHGKDGTVNYVNILGGDIKRDDIDVTNEDLEARYEADKNLTEFAGMDEEAIKAILKERMIDEEVELRQLAQWMPIDVLNAHSGKSFLLINNTVESAYYFSGPNYTLKAESYYEISVWVRTYFGTDKDGNPIFVNDNQGAYIELYLGSANEAGAPMIFKAVDTGNKDYVPGTNASNEISAWKQMKFYVATRADDVTSVKLKLALGKYYSDETKNGITQGYAMFDDIQINTVDEELFNRMADAVKPDPDDEDKVIPDNILVRTVTKDSTTGKTDTDDDEPTVPANKFNLDALWWMIPTILLGLLIIIVVVVFVIKKFKPRKKAGVVVEAPPTSEAIDEKHERYDSNNE